MVRLCAFGIYSYRLTDPKLFHREVSGTRKTFTVEDLDGQLRNTMIAAITNTFGSSNVPFLDMAGNQLEFAKAVRLNVDPMFARLGLTLDSLVVENISLPEERRFESGDFSSSIFFDAFYLIDFLALLSRFSFCAGLLFVFHLLRTDRCSR